MKYEPWARLTTRITPKMSESPLASRNRRAPYERPLNVWVTQNSAVTGLAYGWGSRGGLRLARPRSQAEQTPRVLPQDAGPVARGQLDPAHDDLARPRRPHVETEVAADHHAVRAHEADEVLHRRGRVADRVVREPSEIGVERTLRDALRLRPHLLPVGEPADEVRQGAAGMRQADLELREPVEHAAEDEVRGGDGGVERVAEEVVEVVAPQPVAGADHGERVQQDGQPPGLAGRENRREGRVRQLAPVDVGAEVDAADAGQRGRALELDERARRILHRQRRAADEAVGERAVGLAHGVVHGGGEAPAEVAVGPID